MIHRSVIFDLDGTICDNRHRQHFLDRDPKDWVSFFNHCIHDSPFPYVVALYRALQAFGYEMLLCSGRPDSHRKQTEWWLAETGRISYAELIMRRHGDYRPDTVVKKEMLDDLLQRGKQIAFVIDDRPDVVRMWRDNAIPCFAVDDSLWFEKEKQRRDKDNA